MANVAEIELSPEEVEMSLTDHLSEFVLNFSLDDLDHEAKEVLKLSLIDWLAVGIRGVEEPVSEKVFGLISEEGGQFQATVFGKKERFPARAAALFNGTTSHALDYDDTHFLNVGHPSVVAVSAVLAVAEREKVTGKDFLESVAVGFEIAARVGAWLGRRHYEAGFHQTATAGCFGATFACAHLLKLDRDALKNAIGLASTRASGLKNQFGTMGKPFNAGIAASNAVEASLLAASGMVSSDDGLEGGQGFGDTHQKEGDIDAALSGIGSTMVFPAVSHKFHACCHGLHASLEALHLLREQSDFDPIQIEEIEIVTNPRWLKVCNQPSPKTGLEAKFSYRLTAAMACHKVDTGALESYTETLCNDKDLVGLRERVVVKTDTALSDTASEVRIMFSGNKLASQVVDISEPMAVQLRKDRITAKATALLGVEKATRCIEAVDTLETSTDVRGFTELMTT